MPGTKITITSGEFRGRRIYTPDTSLVHPMGSRERLALFNALESIRGPLAADTTVLDCFCGSGALGLEAISRGARNVVFVDNNQKAIATTEQNIKTLTLKDYYKVIKSDFRKLPAQNLGHFDVILADPPYDNYPADLTELGNLLSDNGVLALSHSTSVDPTQLLPNFKLVRTKKYAAACISLLVKHNH